MREDCCAWLLFLQWSSRKRHCWLASTHAKREGAVSLRATAVLDHDDEQHKKAVDMENRMLAEAQPGGDLLARLRSRLPILLGLLVFQSASSFILASYEVRAALHSISSLCLYVTTHSWHC